MIENTIIIGSGPAGLSAALYTAREGFSPLVIAGINEGGQLLLTTKVENYPGFPDGIDGPELIDLMRKQAEKHGARFLHDAVTNLDLGSKPFKVYTGNGQLHETKSLILATGADSMWLGIESEKKFIGKGVSSCATCDAPFFKGKDVVVVGGGDTAMEDSLFLTKFANSVTIIHRRDAFRASKIMQERVLSNSKIKVLWNSTVEEVLGNSKVSGVRIKNREGALIEIKTDGIFVAIGHKPNTEILKGKLKLDEKGYAVVRNLVETDVPGVFIGGDMADAIYRQAVTAAGTGTMCALKVREYLQNEGSE